MISERAENILLIVDDESSVCRAISRMLQRSVSEITTAISPTEAETILETRQVTHIICDHWFGQGQPLGLSLVATWKKRYPSLKRIVVLTGTDVSQLETPEGVDGVMPKTVDPAKLIKILEL